MTPVYQPMLATPHPQPFTSEDWWFDLKWDGFRCLTYIDGEKVALRSRNGNDLSGRFPELRAVRASEPVVLDGEIVAFGDDGKPSFFLLGYKPPQLVVFDLLHRDRPLIDLPLEERWDQLSAVELFGPVTRSQPTPGEGEALYEAVKSSGLEGVVAKRSGSRVPPRAEIARLAQDRGPFGAERGRWRISARNPRQLWIFAARPLRRGSLTGRRLGGLGARQSLDQ